MKVTVKGIAVRHNGTRYERGDELTIKADEFNEALFTEVEEEKEEKKKKSK